MDDPIQAFLQSIGAGTPGNGMPGGGVLGRQASGPGYNYGFTSYASPNSSTTMDIQPGGLGPLAVFGNLNPYARALIAAAGVMQPTPTASNDTISPGMAGQLPQHPPSTGAMPPVQGPLATPARPYTPTPMGGPYVGSGPPPPWPTQRAPAITMSTPPAPQSAGPVMPPPRPASSPVPGKKRIDPAAVDLGKVPRFTTVQYQVPNGNQYPLNGISRSRAPIYTALNLGGGNA